MMFNFGYSAARVLGHRNVSVRGDSAIQVSLQLDVYIKEIHLVGGKCNSERVVRVPCTVDYEGEQRKLAELEESHQG